jgi:hypothetical protein
MLDAELTWIPVHYLHYQGSKEDSKEYLIKQYLDMFQLMIDAQNKRHLIIDRPHIGACVWAELYKGYDLHEIIEIEKIFMENERGVFNNTLEIFITDTAENIIKREGIREQKEGGYSYNASSVSQKKIEIASYKKYMDASCMRKLIIDLSEKNIDSDGVYQLILKNI